MPNALARLARPVALAALAAATPARAAGETLRLAIWTNYMPDDVLADFEKAAGCTVEVPWNYSSNDELLARLEGQRVGLVAFAGRAVQVCPLTPDHSFFSTVLSSLDTRSAGKGGTKIGEAIKTAVRGFPDGAGNAKLIVLITDGDDQDPYSEEAAKLARNAGVKIVAVGLGSEQGSTITITDPTTGAKKTLEHEGKPVISKLNGEQLRKVALVSEGVYIPAGTSALDLDSIVDGYITPLIREAEAKAVRRIPVEKFSWLVLASMVFLLGALWVGAGAGDRRTR